jgi:lysophospholipase L1-like esterase
VFHDELHALRKLDSQNGQLNKSQFAHDVQKVDAQLHKDKVLTNLHIVMDGHDHARLVNTDHYKDGKPGRHLEEGKGGDYTSSQPVHRGFKPHPVATTQDSGQAAADSGQALGDSGQAAGQAPAHHRVRRHRANPATQDGPGYQPTGETTAGRPDLNRTGQGQGAGDLNSQRTDAQGIAQRNPNDGSTEQIPDQSRTDSTGNYAQLQAAIQRANSGGAPVRILQYGDSHIAGDTEPKTIESELSKLAPIDYSTMAKVGISASYPLQHEQSWINQPMQQKNPDLVVLSFGSNDSAGQVNKQAYEKQYETLVEKIRQQSPNASILIVGPTDGHGSASGKPLPGLDNVIAAQKEVAAKYGLDFVDMRAAMGGPGSIDEWRAHGLAGPDKLHFTTKGYQLIAQTISGHLESSLGYDSQNRDSQTRYA